MAADLEYCCSTARIDARIPEKSSGSVILVLYFLPQPSGSLFYCRDTIVAKKSVSISSGPLTPRLTPLDGLIEGGALPAFSSCFLDEKLHIIRGDELPELGPCRARDRLVDQGPPQVVAAGGEQL